MSKRINGVLSAILLLSYASMAQAASDDFMEGMNKKLARGAINSVTGCLEFPAEIIRKAKNNGVIGAAGGIFTGIVRSAGRTFSGFMDVLTFWAANPEDNTGVGFPLNSEYAWEDPEPYDMFEPNFFEAAIFPVGRKFARGSANILVGFLEIPGQTLKGISEGEVATGMGKGLWLWLSRLASGITDIFSILVPIPEENMGIAFEEEWPWEGLAGH